MKMAHCANSQSQSHSYAQGAPKRHWTQVREQKGVGGTTDAGFPRSGHGFDTAALCFLDTTRPLSRAWMGVEGRRSGRRAGGGQSSLWQFALGVAPCVPW